ncbi:hypothetical protein C7T94_19110 [Pedobacter yulinensis]|uniref:Uncharacterized protein n=1 Tax=Pedobacter yulinensis TaxID=2126353 RepID=A0A2T3HGN1_9SPHI|nr:hypothetical protein C7T94_19110 [Pedobacter yulinensis]
MKNTGSNEITKYEPAVSFMKHRRLQIKILRRHVMQKKTGLYPGRSIKHTKFTRCPSGSYAW